MPWLLLLLIAVSPFALAHRLDGSNYSGHDANQCSYADGNTGARCRAVTRSPTPATPVAQRVRIPPTSRGHSHAGFPANKSQTQACQDYLARLNPPPVVDPPPPPSTCEHGDACDGYGEHEADEHDCAVCDEQDGNLRLAQQSPAPRPVRERSGGPSSAAYGEELRVLPGRQPLRGY